MDRRYRQMLMQRSGADRLKMGASMLATARALAVASLRAEEPSLPPGALRRGLFLRFYGGDFAPEERERIAARLDTGTPRPGASLKRVPLNWEDLELALTTSSEAWTCYLDVRTGEVQMVAVDPLAVDNAGLTDDAIDEGLEAGHLIAIEPVGSSVEYGWMAEFSAAVGDASLRERLEVALDGRGAFRRFKNVLLGAPAERERWFRFRDRRLRAAAQQWLAEQGIEPATDPPASR